MYITLAADMKHDNNSISQLFTSIEFFLTTAALQGLHQVSNFAFATSEIEQFNSCRKNIIILLLEFADILITKHTNEALSDVSIMICIFLLSFIYFLVNSFIFLDQQAL